MTPKLAQSVRVLIDRDATLEARRRFPSMPDQVVGTFDSSASMYRIFDGEELARILRTGQITGGTYSAKAERAHGASWGHDLTAIIEWGNRLRGKRYGDDLFLAKLDILGMGFHHLSPKVPFDPNGPAEQSATMALSVCSPSLGCSMSVALDDVTLFVVHHDHQIRPISKPEAKAYVDTRPKRDVDLREVNPQLLQGAILDHDVRVWKDGPRWKVVLNDDRPIVNDAPTKEDAIDLAKMSIRLRPGRPVLIPYAVLLKKRQYEKHFEAEPDPSKIRGDFGLKPRDKVVVEKGSRGLNIAPHASAVVADVYQRPGERSVNVKLLVGDRPVALYAQHPNRLGDPEIALMNSGGDRILIRKKSAVNRLAYKVAARYAALQVGYGPAGTGLSFQDDFPPTTECHECGEHARLALVVREPSGEDAYVSDMYPNTSDAFWPHDSAAFAIYLCPDSDCAEATTLWNQS